MKNTTSRETRSLVYAAAPLDLIGTRRHARYIAATAARFPALELFDPLAKQWPTCEWLEVWPRLLPRIAVVTVLSRSDDTVGRGVWREVRDARAMGIPALVWHRRALHPLVIDVLGRSYRVWARVLPVGAVAGGGDS